MGEFNLNWDATLDNRKCKMGVGAIFHDEIGIFIGTYRAVRTLPNCSFTAEAYGFLLSV